MMMQRRVTYLFLLLLFLSGCTDETNREVDYGPLINASEEAIFFQDVVNETYKLLVKADRETELNGGGQTLIGNVLVTAVEISDDSTIFTFDFSRSYFDWDNVHKDSLIKVTVTGGFGSEDGFAEAEMDGFKIGDRTLTGKIFFAFQEVSGSFTTYSLTSQSLGYSDTLNQSHSIEFNQHLMLKKVYGIPGVYDNLWFKAGGEASGVSSSGKAYHYTIMDTIVDSVGCPWPSEGIIGMSFGNSNDSTYIDLIDQDSCSNQYKINIANKYFTQKGL